MLMPSIRLVNAPSNQHGVGMIEVLVALFILAVAVLGFGSLQVGAMQLTQESGQRTEAQRIASDLNNKVLANALLFAGKTNTVANMATVIGAYKTAVTTAMAASDATNIAEQYKCITGTGVCTVAQAITVDAHDLARQAKLQGMRLAIVPCQIATGGAATQCAIVAWGDTNPTVGSSSKDCITTTDVYNPAGTCFRGEGLL